MSRPRRFLRAWFLPLIVAAVLGLSARVLSAQQPATSQPTEADELSLDQSKLTDRYERVEKLILRMAEFDQAQNPRRSVLLKNAFTLAKDRDIQLQMEAASRMLQQQKLQRAVEEQEQVRRDMQALLELLLTENRADRLKDEQARVRDYIREIERLERMQRSVQARTEGGVEAQQLQREQKQVADGARRLHDQIEETELADNPLEAGDAGDAEQNQGAGQRGESPSPSEESDDSSQPDSGDAQNDRQKTDDPPGAEDDDQDDSRPDGPRGNPLRSKPDTGQPDSQNKLRTPQDRPGQPASPGDSAEDASPDSQDGASPPDQAAPAAGGPAQEGDDPGQNDDAPQTPQQQPDFPGLNRVQEAEQKMREAEQKLAKAKREGAIEDQREAVKKLAEAKAELEKILRQMREEEIERVLATLEVRFRKMLEMQLRVYEDTLRVARIPAEDRDRFMEIEAGKLAFQERRIVVEADKCLAVLREEGSSVAFPESTQQMRDDMQQVSDLLTAANVGRLTQGIEEDIIEALEEMIAALEQAQSDQEQRKQDMPSMPPMDPGDLPLVNALAELRMLKALQIRINRRTSRYAAMLDDADDPVGKPTDDKLLSAIRELAERQQRLQEITRDISMGKNK